MSILSYYVKTFSPGEFFSDAKDKVKRKISQIHFNPFFFTKPYEKTILGHHITWYQPFKVLHNHKTYLDHPSFVSSVFLVLHATVHFFNFAGLTALDFGANLFRLKVNPIGDLPFRIGREHFRRDKTTLFKLHFDEIGKFAKLSYVHSAQDFQKAIQYFPIQVTTLNTKKIFENKLVEKVLFNAFKYFFIARLKILEGFILISEKICQFAPNKAMENEKEYFESSLVTAQENLEMITCLELLEAKSLDSQ